MNATAILKPAMLFAAGTIATVAQAQQPVGNPTRLNNDGEGYGVFNTFTLVGEEAQYSYYLTNLFGGVEAPKTYAFEGLNGAQVTSLSSDTYGSFYPTANDPTLGSTATFGVKGPKDGGPIPQRLAAGDRFYGLRFTGNGQQYVGYVNVNAAGSRINEIAFERAAGISAAVPEPQTWALMILGFGGAGLALRRRRRQPATAAVA